MSRTNRKIIIVSTPLSPMMLILMGLMFYILVDMRHQEPSHSNQSKVSHLNYEPPPLVDHPILLDRHPDHIHSFPLSQPNVHSHPHGTDSFRKIGFLTSRELADSVILPLFGDPAPYRRHRWNYYTMTDTHQRLSSVKLPVMYRERSCVDEVACDEIYTGDIVRVHGYESPFVVHVY
jgi:hypothetical protein